MPLYPGDRTTINATIRDNKGVKVDPSSHEIKVYDPDGTLEGTFNDPVKDDVGEYHLDYDIPEDGKAGTWKAVWKATIGTGDKTEIITFDVFER
jgi:uncharacterized protein YfaS (alpha-2-macroglobulin family)